MLIVHVCYYYYKCKHIAFGLFVTGKAILFFTALHFTKQLIDHSLIKRAMTGNNISVTFAGHM